MNDTCIRTHTLLFHSESHFSKWKTRRLSEARSISPNNRRWRVNQRWPVFSSQTLPYDGHLLSVRILNRTRYLLFKGTNKPTFLELSRFCKLYILNYFLLRYWTSYIVLLLFLWSFLIEKVIFLIYCNFQKFFAKVRLKKTFTDPWAIKRNTLNTTILTVCFELNTRFLEFIHWVYEKYSI